MIIPGRFQLLFSLHLSGLVVDVLSVYQNVLEGVLQYLFNQERLVALGVQLSDLTVDLWVSSSQHWEALIQIQFVVVVLRVCHPKNPLDNFILFVLLAVGNHGERTVDLSRGQFPLTLLVVDVSLVTVCPSQFAGEVDCLFVRVGNDNTEPVITGVLVDIRHQLLS